MLIRDGELRHHLLHAAVRYYAGLGICIRRVVTDNGPAFVSGAFSQALRDLGLRHVRTRPYTLELTLSRGRFAAWVSSRIDGRRRRVVHRWRGARHANADGGQPVFDAPRMVFGVVAPFEVDR